MGKEVMKRLVVMTTVVLAISHNHRRSLTHFPHSRPIIFLSSHHNAKIQKNPTHRRNPNLDSKNTPIEEGIHHHPEFTEEQIKCLVICVRLYKHRRVPSSILLGQYDRCIRRCLGARVTKLRSSICVNYKPCY